MSSPLNVHAASSSTTAPAIADSEHSNTGQLQGPHREGKRLAHASSGAPERDMSGAIRGGGCGVYGRKAQPARPRVACCQPLPLQRGARGARGLGRAPLLAAAACTCSIMY